MRPEDFSAAEWAAAITGYAAQRCTDCNHMSAHHSDIGNCELCDCPCFEEAGGVS
ncbi:hypothetical protein D7316_00034 [Gordonia insulae]|uniref:Uncharacterized protein n=1 Tax=Gordonia insulae TaxID=2420509 RepID=A0A3G8JGA3_9ACTN|nr:hypothetical protein D7316_00034 [Gordonia insulae]